MRKLLIGLLICLFMFSLITVCKAEKLPSYEYLKAVTVLITANGADKDEQGNWYNYSWKGTGSIISIDEKYTYILTNAHVVGYESSTKKILNAILLVHESDNSGGVKAEIIDIESSDKADLAIIRIPSVLHHKCAVRGIAEGNIQDKIYMVGHHLGLPFIYGEGVISQIIEGVLYVQLPIAPGNSGSAIINQDGNLIGVSFAVLRTSYFTVEQTNGLAVNIQEILWFLKKNNIPYNFVVSSNPRNKE